MPTYNQQLYVAESIESALQQDYDNLEIVIGDDCSKDETWEIVKIYQSKYPGKIKAFKNSENLGITGNCSEILKRCTGEYIAFTAGDDLFFKTKIRRQVEQMVSDQRMILCYHDVEVFRSQDNTTLRYWNHGAGSSKPHVGSARKILKRIIEEGTSFLGAQSVMVRRNAVKLSGYDYRVPIASDWLMWIEVLANAELDHAVGFIPSVLSRYRLHGQNITLSEYFSCTDQLVTLALTESRYPELIGSIDIGKKRIRQLQGMRLIARGENQTGRTLLIDSLKDRYITLRGLYWLGLSLCPTLRRLRGLKFRNLI